MLVFNKYRSFLYIWCALFSCFVFASQTTELNLQGQMPRVEFDTTRYDFGEIYRGQKVSYDYEFQNTGNGILVFSNIHAACGCMNTRIYDQDKKIQKNIFQPHEKGFIVVEFNSRDFSGYVLKIVTLETNMGSSSPTVTLMLTANILEELQSNPALLYLGKIQHESQKNFTIAMKLFSRAKENFENKDFKNSVSEDISKFNISSSLKESILSNKEHLKVVAVESSVSYLKVKLLPVVTGSSPRISVTLDPNVVPIGPIHEKIRVWNNSTYYKDFEIPVIGEVVGHVQISAKYVEFGVVSDIKSSQRTVVLKSSEKSFMVKGVQVELKQLPEFKNIKESDLFEIKKERLSYGRAVSDGSITSYLLKFRLLYPRKMQHSQNDQNIPGTNVSGVFLVKTNDPDYKEIKVPFFGVLRKEP